MPRVPLTITNLAELDPRLPEAVAAELRTICCDLQDRPGVSASRKLALTLTFEPDAPEGTVDIVNVKFKLATSLPAKESPAYQMRPHGDGSLLFHTANTDDLRAPTLMQAAEDAHDETPDAAE